MKKSFSFSCNLDTFFQIDKNTFPIPFTRDIYFSFSLFHMSDKSKKLYILELIEPEIIKLRYYLSGF